MGARWKVGDGKKIDVWKDQWLKKPSDYKASPPNQNIPTPLAVTSLINDERSRKIEMVKDIFPKANANLLEKIPLSRLSKPDRLI